MEMVCLASSAWLGHREKSLALLSRIDTASASGCSALLLDLPSVLRESGDSFCVGDRPLHEVAFRSWITEGLHEDGVLDAEKVRRAPLQFPSGGIVVINANCFKSVLIAKALTQLRIALYSLQEWPGMIVLVADDMQLFQVTPMLSSAFYLQPNIQRGATVGRQLTSFSQYARLLRLFGKNVGSIAKFARKIVARWQTKRDNKVAGRLGWTWEE